VAAGCIRETVAAVLGTDYTVIETDSVGAAADALLASKPTLAFVDLRRSPAGSAICRRIKGAASTRLLPIVAFAEAGEQHLISALDDGADHVLPFPPSRPELHAHIRAALRNRLATERLEDATQVIFDKDESPREDTTIEVLRSLKPAFKKDGTVTAGNAPGVNDGAAALVVTSAKRAKELGAPPMVRIVAQATSGVDPKWVMMAPVDAVRKIWEKTGWKNEDVDLYELNEAFSVQALGVMRELGLDPNKVNVNGGAVAIGHPIGASGARVLVTLIYEMMRRDVRRGIAALCLGGGNAVAMAVER